MIKLIACDLDGTLLPKGEKRLTAEVENAVKACINKGIKFALITGRDYPSATQVVDFMHRDIYFMCCGGAVGLRGGKVVYSKPVSAENVILTFKAVKKSGKDATFCSDKCIYAFGSKKFTEEIKAQYGDGAEIISEISEIKGNIYKISVFGDEKCSVFDTVPHGMRCWYKRGGLEEYINRFAGKAQALGDLMMREGAFAGEVLCAGDEIQGDGEMLKKAGNAVSTNPQTAKACGVPYVSTPMGIFSEVL